MDSVPAFIYPPTSEELRRQLQAMVRQFEMKKTSEQRPREVEPPEASYLSRTNYRETVYKIGVLRTILDPQVSGPVLSIQLAEKLRRENGGALNMHDFISACRSVTDYLKQAQPASHLQLISASPA